MADGPTPGSGVDPLPGATGLAMLSFADLHHYSWARLPNWVFDVLRLRMVWANASGLQLWRAASLDELLERDFSDASSTTVSRLLANMQQHAAGRLLRESWTLYPADVPMTSILASRGITLPDGRQAILFASEPLAASFDPAALRGVEAMQHTSVRVAMHDLGKDLPLMRNPSAVAAFGPITDPTDGPRDAEQGFGQLFDDATLGLAVLEVVRRGGSHSGEALLHTLQGPRWHAIDARPVRDPANGAAVLLFNGRDISDLKAALAALEAARDAAEAANRAKSSFLANMSHEIRTPMNGVIGLTELVLATALDARQRQFLELVLGSAQSLMLIINDILDLSKIEADKVELESAPMSLCGLLVRALTPLQVQAATRGLHLDWQISPDLPEQVLADTARWQQILTNLAGNAVKFTERGQVQVRLSAAAIEGQHLLLACSVSDTGIGISPEALAQVFERFTQADNSVTRRYGGTGLGLAIVQRLVELMGGRISAESQLGAGSTFRFSVPVGLIASADAP